MEVVRRVAVTLGHAGRPEFHRVVHPVVRSVEGMPDATAAVRLDRRAVRVVDSLADHRVQVILEASAGQEVLPDSRGQLPLARKAFARRRTRLIRRFLQ